MATRDRRLARSKLYCHDGGHKRASDFMPDSEHNFNHFCFVFAFLFLLFFSIDERKVIK